MQVGNRRLSAGVMQNQDCTQGQLAKVDLLESLMQVRPPPTTMRPTSHQPPALARWALVERLNG
jgi:hypothetical protein